MAAELEEPSSVEMSKEELKLITFNYADECPICLECHVNPKVLPCLHPLCASCLDQMCADKRPGMSFSCPGCRRRYAVPRQGSDAFADMFSLRQPIDCDVRETTVARIQRAGDMPGRILKVPFCGKHDEALPILAANNFCRECKSVICLNCIHFGHNMAHRLRNIDESADEMRQNLIDLLMEFRAVLVELGPLRNDLDDWKQEFDVSISTMRNQIALEADRVMEVINRNKDDLMEQLNTLKKNVTDEIGVVEVDFGRKLVQFRLFVRICSQVINEESFDDVVHHYDELSLMAQELRRPPGHELNMTFSRWTFATMDSELPPPPARQRNWVGRIARNYSEEDRAKQRKMFMGNQKTETRNEIKKIKNAKGHQNKFTGVKTADVRARENATDGNGADNRLLKQLRSTEKEKCAVEEKLRNCEARLRLAEKRKENKADSCPCPTVSESCFSDLFV